MTKHCKHLSPPTAATSEMKIFLNIFNISKNLSVSCMHKQYVSTEFKGL